MKLVSWNFTVPYVSEYQKSGLAYQYKAFQDYENALQRVVRDDVETTIIRAEDDIMYEIFPAEDDFQCWKTHVHGGTGPTRRRTLLAHPNNTDVSILSPLNTKKDDPDPDPPQQYLSFILPDLTEDRWRYKGSQKYHRDRISGDTEADIWEWDLTEGDMEMKYLFYTEISTGYPLELNMLGINLYTGGHKDNYIAYFYDYKEVGEFDQGVFDEPRGLKCSDEDPDLVSTRSTKDKYKKVAPNKHWGHTLYDRYVHRVGRRHASRAEYYLRKRHFETSSAFVQNWNSKIDQKRHAVALNHFADWSSEEYRALLGLHSTRHGADLRQVPHKVATVHNFTSNPHFLPAEVIWKGTPADGPVKDQAACGSCWAFSATASLETAVYRTTGRQTLLSEQEMMDCGWEEPGLNTGCYGGQQDSALVWALLRKFVTAQDDYPYRGVNDFCKRNASKVPINGTLVVLEGGAPALKAALIAQGPMAVSVDAEADSFRFYSGGLYSNPDCATAAADLNHAVIVSGYGLDKETGREYWLVKNMWSPYWGEEGYIRIAIEPNDCGIATQPMYVATE